MLRQKGDLPGRFVQKSKAIARIKKTLKLADTITVEDAQDFKTDAVKTLQSLLEQAETKGYLTDPQKSTVTNIHQAFERWELGQEFRKSKPSGVTPSEFYERVPVPARRRR